MKRNLILAFLLITTCLLAQSPQSFKYQALLRDKNGVLIMDKTVNVRIGILQGSITGTSVYSEIHSVKTSTSGTINLEIGKGTLPTGTFSAIEWGKNSYFVKIEMDPAGGSAYELVGTSQLLSVPYALYAEKSGDEKWSQSGTSIYYNLGRIGINSTLPATKLEINGGGDLDVLAIKNENNSSGLTNLVSSNTDFHGSAFIGKRSRGTLITPSTVQAGDRITGLYGRLYSNGDYQNSAAIQMYVGANPGTFSYPTNIRFETTGTGQIDRTERMRITENGNVGIGTNSPLSKLDVSGSINATQYLLNGSPVNFSSGQQWGVTGSSLYYNTGNVGIGVASPTVKLDIDGGTNLDVFNLRNNNNSLGINASIYSATDYHGSALIGKRARGNYTSPSTPLNGDRITGIYGSIYANNDFQNAGAIHMYVGPNPGASSYPVNIRFETTNTNEIIRKERMRITEDGNIGIGTTTPSYKLDVAGTINASQFLINGSPLSNQSQLWKLSSSDIYYNSGKIGIGTTTPVSNLDVAGLNSTIGLHKVQFKSTESENKARLEIRNDPSDLGNIYSTSLDRIGDTSEDLIFGLQQPVNNTNAWNIFESWRGAGLMVSASGSDLMPLTLGIDRVEKARLAPNGNFGIGTNNPKTKLQIQDGDIYINSISSGVIMKSPNGQCWRMTVSNGGAPVFTMITCP